MKQSRPTLAQSLADELERQIKAGVYKSGERLPSLRDLAQRHNYAKNTVVAAFDALILRGLVEARRGAGYFVRALPPLRATERESGSLGRAMDIVWMMRAQLKSEPGTLSLGDGFPPVEWLADMRLDRYHQKVARSGMGSLFRYGNRFGYEPLRQQLVRRLSDYGIAADPRQIVTTHGANDAMDIVIRYFVPPGATVFVDDPGYYPLFGKLKLAGARIVGVPRLADGPDLPALEALLAEHRPRLYFTQSTGHNPTGSDLSAAKAFKVLQLAQVHDLLLVEDDPLADFKPASAPRLSSLDGLERTIYIGSFSKSLSAALRVGFIACDADLASDLADLKALVHVSSSEYCERTLEVILGEGHYQRHIQRLRGRLGQATQLATERLAAFGAELYTRPSHSLYLWGRLPGFDDSLRLAAELLPHQLVLAPGRVFAVDAQACTPWVRFNVGGVCDPRFQPLLGAGLGALQRGRIANL